MQEQIVEQNLKCRLNKQRPWKTGLGLLGIALLLSLALGSSAVLNHLVPRVPGRAPGVTARMGWYFHSGQLQADVRTLAAAYQFLKQTAIDTPTVDDHSDPIMAGKSVPTSPKS